MLRNIDGCLGQTNPTTAPTSDAVEHLVEARLLSETGQLTGQVLLQRLATLFGATSQRSVHVIRDVTHKDVRMLTSS